jgi:FkbM family methyltransferase
MVVTAHLSTGSRLDESGETWLADRVAPVSRTFVDVGANVGDWAMMFASRAAQPQRGILIDPHPQAVERLGERVRSAGIEGLEVVQAAVGDKAGRATFHAEQYCGETSGFYSAALLRPATPIEVEVVRLDDLAESRGLAEIDMLKIDAEGHDARVLLGAERLLRRNAVAVIQFEYNRPWIMAGSTLTQVSSWLNSLGYEVKLLRRDGLYDVDIGKVGEFFGYSNFCAFRAGALGGVLDDLPRRRILW